MQDKICIHCIVSGHVQGVWFRASTQQEAKKLNIVGWVKNLPSGEVEVMAAGDKAQVEHLYQWLKDGPPLAKVTGVTYEELVFSEFQSFEITK